MSRLGFGAKLAAFMALIGQGAGEFYRIDYRDPSPAFRPKWKKVKGWQKSRRRK